MAYSLEKGLIIFLTSMLALAAVSFLSPFVGPFLLALLLAALIDQPANRLEKLGLPRGLAVLLLLAGLAVLVAGSLILVVLNVVQDVNQLAEKLPEFRYEVLTKIVWLNQLVAELPPPVYDLIRSSTSQLAQTLELLVGGFFAAVAELPSALARLVVAVLAAFFLARDGRALARSLVASLPPSWRRRGAELNRGIFAGMVGFVRAQVLLVAVSAVLCTASLLIFGMPYAWLLGTLAGILDIIPLMGPGTLFVPLAVWQWLTGSKAVAAGLATSLGLVLLIRQGIEPLLIAGQANLHPLTSLAAIYFGVRFWGFPGLFMGPLLAITLKALWLGWTH
ncbi:MAG: AI-2E family transporter [Limnochordia bacterium]|jgi:sporulation integral membrane protein YtvI